MQERNRELYPRGLLQPESGFRFSLDALLLACYPGIGKNSEILDLGCGCGVVGFGLLLLHQDKHIRVTGVDVLPDMTEYALENARMLDLQSGFTAINMDIKNIRQSGDVLPESFDQVVVNPPYRKTGEGRLSPRQARNVACFEQETGLEDFVQAASYALKNRGRVNFIYPAESEVNLLHSLLQNRLEPKRMRFVHSRYGDPAGFVLLEAVKNGGRGMIVQPPLFLYADQGNAYSGEALVFCPFLECNSGER